MRQLRTSMLTAVLIVSGALGPTPCHISFWLCLEVKNIMLYDADVFSDLGMVSGQNLFWVSLLTNYFTYCTISTDPLHRNIISHMRAKKSPTQRRRFGLHISDWYLAYIHSTFFVWHKVEPQYDRQQTWTYIQYCTYDTNQDNCPAEHINACV